VWLQDFTKRILCRVSNSRRLISPAHICKPLPAIRSKILGGTKKGVKVRYLIILIIFTSCVEIDFNNEIVLTKEKANLDVESNDCRFYVTNGKRWLNGSFVAPCDCLNKGDSIKLLLQKVPQQNKESSEQQATRQSVPLKK